MPGLVEQVGEENLNSCAASLHCSGLDIQDPARLEVAFVFKCLNQSKDHKEQKLLVIFFLPLYDGHRCWGSRRSTVFLFQILFFYSLANWMVIKQLISNGQWPGTIFGIEGAAGRKFSFQGVHNVEQSMRAAHMSHSPRPNLIEITNGESLVL